jgi:hypothetical protein
MSGVRPQKKSRRKKMKKVSQIASLNYQAAKKAATGAWNWKAEWRKAMKAACVQVINKVKEAVVMMAVVAKKATTLIEVAQEMASNLGGNVWAKEGITRVYVAKNYITIKDDGIDVTNLGRNQYEEMMAESRRAAAAYNLPLYQVYKGRKMAVK